VQIFDSWAGVWPEAGLRRWCLEPVKAIVARIEAERPGVPVIVFPRGAGVLYQAYAAECGAAALGLDTTVPLGWAREVLQPKACLQGNLDPLALVAGGDALRRGVDDILAALGGGPFVFNLGHGIVPETPPEHVAEMLAQVRAWRGR
jgi:uroporphyrinogen decarboxylase